MLILDQVHNGFLASQISAFCMWVLLQSERRIAKGNNTSKSAMQCRAWCNSHVFFLMLGSLSVTVDGKLALWEKKKKRSNNAETRLQNGVNRNLVCSSGVSCSGVSKRPIRSSKSRFHTARSDVLMQSAFTFS